MDATSQNKLSTAAFLPIFNWNSAHRIFQVVPCLLTVISILVNHKNSIKRFIVTSKLKRYIIVDKNLYIFTF